MPKGVYDRSKNHKNETVKPEPSEQASTLNIIEKFADKPTVKDICKGTLEAKCGHNKNLHFDGLKGWCNAQGCVCDAFYS